MRTMFQVFYTGIGTRKGTFYTGYTLPRNEWEEIVGKDFFQWLLKIGALRAVSLN